MEKYWEINVVLKKVSYNVYVVLLVVFVCSFLQGMVLAVDPANPPAQFQVTVEDPDNPGADITVNLYKRSMRRGTNFKLWKWDFTNGYVETTPPPVRTYRGFVEEHPNILICATLFPDGVIKMQSYNPAWGRGYHWKINWDFSGQLPSAPNGTGLEYPSTTLPPDNPTTRMPTIGRAVQPDGGIQVAEVGYEVMNKSYVNWGKDDDVAVAKMESLANMYDMTMMRDCQINMQVSQIVIRTDLLHTAREDGNAHFGTLSAQWKAEPLLSNGWDTIHATNGYYATQNNIGQNESPFSCGAMIHEEGHNWDGVHSVYHYSAMEGNRPHHGPFNVDRIIEKRLESMIEGDLVQLVGDYSDPIHPYAYVDVARISVDTSVDIDVLANDWDSNGDSISIVDAVANFGTVSINGDDTLHYTPPAGFEGKDIIVYTIQDDSAYLLKSRDMVHIEVVNNDLMVHYDFDETSGTIADNKTGNANLDGEIVEGDFAQNSVPSPVPPNYRGVRSISNERYNRADRNAITVGRVGSIIPSPLVYDRTVIPGSPWDTGDRRDNNAYNASPFDWERGEHGNYCDPMDGDYTLAFWFKQDADNFVGNYDFVRLATKYYNAEWACGFSLKATEDGKLSVQIMPFYQYGAAYDRRKNWIILESDAGALTPRKWHHAALVIDRTGGDDVRLYLDGQLVDENTTQLLPGQQIFMGRKPIRLGDTNGNTTCFDDLRVYAKALASPEVDALWDMQDGFPIFHQNPVDETVFVASEYSRYLLGDVNLGSDGPWTFTKVSGPLWINVTADGQMTGTAYSSNIGVNPVVVRITDNSGDYAECTYNITVEPYAETFTNDGASAESLDFVGWGGYYTSAATDCTFEAISGSTDIGVQPDDYWRVKFQYGSRQPLLMYDNELGSLQLEEITNLSVDLDTYYGGGTETVTVRYAIKVNGSWYATESTMAFTKGQNPSSGTFNFPLKDNLDKANWRMITLIPDTELSLGGVATNSFTGHEHLESVGLYCSTTGAGAVWLEVDNFSFTDTSVYVSLANIYQETYTNDGGRTPEDLAYIDWAGYYEEGATNCTTVRSIAYPGDVGLQTDDYWKVKFQHGSREPLLMYTSEASPLIIDDVYEIVCRPS